MEVYNNLSRKLEVFEPIKPPHVTLYSCGPTVYDHSHIGHARNAIVWDVLYRYLKYRDYQVKWARNITNVDDKIVARAKEQGISPDQLSRQFTYEFWHDMSMLNVSWPDCEPRATDYIDVMTRFIESLIDKGLAYAIGGDVYFRTAKHAQYGQLKGLPVSELRKGLARIEENTKKEDQLDFALWKAFPGEEDAGNFASPWGYGRPGWHLECSAMIDSIFFTPDDTHNSQDNNRIPYTPIIDIHAGGDDLIFPHHENECAQSECLRTRPLAKYWMHNGMVMLNGAKMSKSEDNFLTVKDALKKFKPNTIRYFCLGTHYKKQINFTDEALRAAETGFEHLYQFLKNTLGDMTKIKSLKTDETIEEGLIAKFNAAMDDDLSTPKALAILFENITDRSQDKNKLSTLAQTIAYLLRILGFDLVNHEKLEDSGRVHSKNNQALDATVKLLLELRDEARKNKNFALSDRIRDELTKANVQVMDYKDKPSEWVLI